MLMNALILATMSITACILIYKKLPRKIRKVLEKHTLLSDAIALALTYALLGGTLTALLAAAMVGVFTSILLEIAKDPESYMFVFDLRDVIKEKLALLKESVNEYGRNYNKKKLAKEVVA